MGIVWDQENIDNMEEGVMVVGRHRYPPCHGRVTPSSQSPLTIAEKGVEVGDGGDGHLAEDGEWSGNSRYDSYPPQTPGLTDILSVLCVENSECVCSYECTGVHAHEVGPGVDIICTVMRQDNADMRNVRQEPELNKKHLSTKNNLVTVLQTPNCQGCRCRRMNVSVRTGVVYMKKRIMNVTNVCVQLPVRVYNTCTHN